MQSDRRQRAPLSRFGPWPGLRQSGDGPGLTGGPHKIAVAIGLQAAIMCGSILGTRRCLGVLFTMDEVRGSRSTASDSESLILVDEADREVGHLDEGATDLGAALDELIDVVAAGTVWRWFGQGHNAHQALSGWRVRVSLR